MVRAENYCPAGGRFQAGKPRRLEPTGKGMDFGCSVGGGQNFALQRAQIDYIGKGTAVVKIIAVIHRPGEHEREIQFLAGFSQFVLVFARGDAGHAEDECFRKCRKALAHGFRAYADKAVGKAVRYDYTRGMVREIPR